MQTRDQSNRRKKRRRKKEKISPKTGGVEKSHESRNVHPKETIARQRKRREGTTR